MGLFDNIISKGGITMKKRTHEDFIYEVKLENKKNIEVLGKYVNMRTKIKVKHIDCGHVWEVSPRSLIKNVGCPKCANNVKRTTQEFKEEINSLTKGKYIVLGNYKSNREKIKIKHCECGHTFYMTPKSFLGGQRCPKHRYEKSSLSNRIDEDEIHKRLKDNLGTEYIMIEYNGSASNGLFKHVKCNKEFKSVPYQMIKGVTGCPHCYKSKGEDLVEKYLIENKYDYKKQYTFKDCKNIRPLPFDFAIFKNDELMYLIEYDGEQHFKPKFGEENFKITKRNDNIKNEYCSSNNINLIRIPYKRIYSNVDFKKYIYQELNKLLSC